MSKAFCSGFLPTVTRLAFAIVVTASSALGEDDSGFMLDRAAFESWVFQQDGSQAEGLRRLEAEFDRILRSVKSSAELSTSEEKMLVLAGKGDIKRFIDLVYQAYIPIGGKDLSDEAFNDAWERTLPLQRKLNNGLFEEGSLFHKVLMRVLSEEERIAWINMKTEQLKREKIIIVDVFIADLERSVPLLQRQREKLREILVEQTPQVRNPDENGLFIIHYFFSKIDEQVCNELFDEEQIRLMSGVRRQGQEMGQWLVEEGVLMEEPSK